MTERRQLQLARAALSALRLPLRVTSAFDLDVAFSFRVLIFIVAVSRGTWAHGFVCNFF